MDLKNMVLELPLIHQLHIPQKLEKFKRKTMQCINPKDYISYRNQSKYSTIHLNSQVSHITMVYNSTISGMLPW